MGLFLPESPEQFRRKKDEINSSFNQYLSPSKNEIDFLLKLQKADDKIINVETQNLEFEHDHLKNSLIETPVKNFNSKSFLKFTRIGSEAHLTPKMYFNEDVISTVPKTVGKFAHSMRKQPKDNSECFSQNFKCQKGSQKQNIYGNKVYCDKCKHLIKERSIMDKAKNMFLSLFIFCCDFFLYQLPSALILYSLALFLLPNTTKR